MATYSYKCVANNGAWAAVGNKTGDENVPLFTYTAVAATNCAFVGFTGDMEYATVDGNKITVAHGTKANVSLVANYAPKFTVAFNANGGTGTMAKQSFVYGVAQKLTDNAFVSSEEAVVFAGWNTKADGIGTTLSDGADGSALSTTPGATVTLYAQWRPANTTISLAGDAGTLKLYSAEDSYAAPVATATDGGIKYETKSGARYRLVCDLTETEAKIWDAKGVLVDGAYQSVYEFDGGAEGVEIEYVVERKSGYKVSVAEAEHGSLSLSAPSEGAGTGWIDEDDGEPRWVAGAAVYATATPDDGHRLKSLAFRSNGSLVAEIVYDDLNPAPTGAFAAIPAIGRDYELVPVFAAVTRSVSAAPDAASAAAFASVKATVDGEEVSSVAHGAEVVFTAALAGASDRLAFEGWYEGGGFVSADNPYTAAATSDLALVCRAKAKVEVALADKDSGASFEVSGTDADGWATLGAAVALEATVPDGKYFDGWYDADDRTRLVSPLASARLTVAGPLSLVLVLSDEEITDRSAVVSVAYANGCDAAMGAISVDGGESAVAERGGVVTLVADAANGWAFKGWYGNADAVGAARSEDARYEHTALRDATLYALFARATDAVFEWEGSDENKVMEWRSKTYVSTVPFNPSACRVDATGYRDGARLTLRVDMFSSPDAAPTESAVLENVEAQRARRLPVRRKERFLQVAVESDAEIDAVFVSTSMEGLRA